MAETPIAHAAGSRKEARARVWLRSGGGRINVNDRELDRYFTTAALRGAVRAPLLATETQGRYDVAAHVDGGGVRGQAEAVRHALTRALVAADEGLRPTLRKEGFLTRDPRMKERKKYGRKRARKGFQYSKR
ncbi:MAG TPA: 30S ribosomal protein S9 [bacterium]|jgi:small subunit ribosomal protein S9|nr:30S ribosomal protein S9 [bacterium]